MYIRPSLAVAPARRFFLSSRGGCCCWAKNPTTLTTLTTLTSTATKLRFVGLRSSSDVPKTSARPFAMTLNHAAPSNVGGVELAAQDAVVGAQPREPLTLDGIRARREKAGKLVAPTASYSDSDMFKSPQAYEKPKAKRWDHLLSPESRARKPCVLKLAAKHLKKPGLVSLGGGLPDAENFPIEALTLTVPTAPDFSHSRGLKDITMGKHDVAERDGVFDLAIALNYAQSIGSAQLVRWVTEHSELVHRPPYADWRCALTIGSTGSLEVAYRMFCDRARGDSLLTEAFSFSTALETAAPLGIRVFGVDMDEQGLKPDSMDALLANWDETARGARRPRLLYTVPSGQNPTGATQSEARRRAIYDVCRRHDVFILEDEPYYFLQMQPYGAAAAAEPTDPQAFLDGLVPSLLSLDVDGRVMRHDSFSKVVVPGSRVGWITASEQVVERYIRHAECCSQGPSGFSQAALYKLLDEEWGHEGYLRWLMHLRAEYAARRDALLAACEKHLPRDIVTWTPPAAGMFLWLQVDHTKHPHAGARTLLEVEEEIFDACVDKGVLLCRGSWFRAEPDRPLTELFFRATYAAASAQQMDLAIERFGAAVRDSFGLTK